jgi:hypothetical protein
MNENERFELQNVAIPLKWQFLAPKMQQIARKTDRTADPKKTQNGKNIFPKTILDPFLLIV